MADERRIAELLTHRRSLLDSMSRDIAYALKHDNQQFAAPLCNNYVQLIQIEQTLRVLRED